MYANRIISITTWLGACATLVFLVWGGSTNALSAAERPPVRTGGRPIFGEGGLIRRLRDEIAAEAAAAAKTPPTDKAPLTAGAELRNDRTADSPVSKAASKPTFREPKPSNKSIAKQATQPASKTVAAPRIATSPVATTPPKPAPQVLVPQVTSPQAVAVGKPVAPAMNSTSTAVASSSVAKSTAPKVIPFKDLLSQPYDKSVVSVLVSDKKKLTAEWKSLFNGKDLTHWESSKFGGDGEITVENGMIVLAEGGDMTGITYQGEVPRVNYALEVEAQRLDGVDFFAGITFPVGDTYMTLVPGGWGGGVFGLSSIDSMDASENETTQARTFKDKQWYKFLIQVTEDRVQVSVDGKVEIDLPTKDKKLSTRGEVESSKPLGICTWRTKGAIRSIRLRPITSTEAPVAQ